MYSLRGKIRNIFLVVLLLLMLQSAAGAKETVRVGFFYLEGYHEIRETVQALRVMEALEG